MTSRCRRRRSPAAVGKDRATVANYMRLLKLAAEVRSDVSSGALTMGHARALVTLADEAAQRRVAREVVSRGLSVREAEAMVRRESSPAVAPPPKTDRSQHPRRGGPSARSRSARASASFARARAAGSRSISPTRKSCSGSTRR